MTLTEVTHSQPQHQGHQHGRGSVIVFTVSPSWASTVATSEAFHESLGRLLENTHVSLTLSIAGLALAVVLVHNHG